MRFATPFLAAMGSVALVACSSPAMKIDTAAPRISCNGHNCTASVTVASSGNWCKPEDILNIDLATGDAGFKSVTWTIATPGYEFSRESFKFGIFIKDDPFDEFKDANVPGNGRTLTIRFDGRSTGRNYRYAITVRRSDGTKPFCETLDPWMIS